MDRINVCAVEAIDRCSRDVQRVAVALAVTQEATSQRIGMSQEQLISRVCAQDGLAVLRVGESVCLSASLHCGDTREGVKMCAADEVRCPLSLGPWTDCPPLLCTLYKCDVFASSCCAIMAAAEAVLEKERPPPP